MFYIRGTSYNASSPTTCAMACLSRPEFCVGFEFTETNQCFLNTVQPKIGNSIPPNGLNSTGISYWSREYECIKTATSATKLYF